MSFEVRNEITNWLSKIGTEVQKFYQNKLRQFDDINDKDIQARVIAKTIIVAGVISFFLGKQFGNKTKQLSFVAVVLYLGCTILNRVSNPQYLAALQINYRMMKTGEGVENFAGNILTQAKRTVEDLTSGNAKDAKKQIEKRAVEDLQTQFHRFFKSAVKEAKFIGNI